MTSRDWSRLGWRLCGLGGGRRWFTFSLINIGFPLGFGFTSFLHGNARFGWVIGCSLSMSFLGIDFVYLCMVALVLEIDPSRTRDRPKAHEIPSSPPNRLERQRVNKD